MSKDAIGEAYRMMDEANQSMVPAHLRKDGWLYRDLPGWLTQEFWQLLIRVLGEGNYKIIACSQRANGDMHGQFFISPKGFHNITTWQAEQAALRPSTGKEKAE